MTTRRAFYLTTALILATWAAHTTFLGGWEVTHLPPALFIPVGIVLRCVVWLTPLFLYMRRHEPRPLASALALVRPAPRRASLIVGVVWLVIAAWLASSPTRPARFSLDLSVFYTLVLAVLEELLMRGLILGQLLRFHRSITAQVITALLFAAMHVPGWIVLEGMGADSIVPSFVVIAIIGGVLGFIRVNSGSLYPPILVHLLSNLFADWLG